MKLVLFMLLFIGCNRISEEHKEKKINKNSYSTNNHDKELLSCNECAHDLIYFRDNDGKFFRKEVESLQQKINKRIDLTIENLEKFKNADNNLIFFKSKENKVEIATPLIKFLNSEKKSYMDGINRYADLINYSGVLENGVDSHSIVVSRCVIIKKLREKDVEINTLCNKIDSSTIYYK